MNDSEYIHLSHNVSNLVYPTKYCLKVKRKLRGGQFWSDGYFVSSAGKHNSEKMIQEYMKKQGKQDEYKQLMMSLK